MSSRAPVPTIRRKDWCGSHVFLIILEVYLSEKNFVRFHNKNSYSESSQIMIACIEWKQDHFGGTS